MPEERNTVKSVDGEMRSGSEECDDVCEEGSTESGTTSGDGESRGAWEKRKQLQVARVVREDDVNMRRDTRGKNYV